MIELLIILKVLSKKSEKKFEDYKILDRETSEITRKKFTKIVKSEMNKISQINKNSHMIYEVPKIVWNFNGESLKKISQKYNQAFPVAYNWPIHPLKFWSPLALICVSVLPKSFGLSCFLDIFPGKVVQSGPTNHIPLGCIHHVLGYYVPKQII